MTMSHRDVFANYPEGLMRTGQLLMFPFPY